MKQAPLALLLVLLITFSAFAQKKQSDREFEGFRGPVKMVTEESAELKQTGSTEIEAAREPRKLLTFDADGNLVSDKVYLRGEEFDIRVYSFIDGERVVKHDVLTKNVLKLSAPGKPGSKPGDPRYSAKIKYEYDSKGNRTEMAWLDPDGRPYLRYVYKQEGNSKEVTVYRSDGSFSHGYKEKLDDKGNELETTSASPNRRSSPKTTYTYLEFDSQGNWIKRKVSRGDSSSISYRTITYH